PAGAVGPGRAACKYRRCRVQLVGGQEGKVLDPAAPPASPRGDDDIAVQLGRLVLEVGDRCEAEDLSAQLLDRVWQLGGDLSGGLVVPHPADVRRELAEGGLARAGGEHYPGRDRERRPGGDRGEEREADQARQAPTEPLREVLAFQQRPE